MTTHKRSVEHRMLKARQGNGGVGTDIPVVPPGGDTGTPDGGDGNGGDGNGGDGNGGNGNGGNGGSSSSSSSSSTTSSTSSTRTTSSTPPPPPPTTTTTSSTSTRTTSTTTATSTTTSSTATSSTTTSSTTSATSTNTSTTRPPVNNIATTGRVAQPSSFADVPTMSVDGAGATITADPLEQTGGISTAGIVGSVAGALAGLAVLGFFIAFLLRRHRRKKAEDDDFGTDFRRSAFVTDNRPPSMAEVATRGHDSAPSLSSPGVAGQGSHGTYGATDNRTGAAATGIALGAASQGLQERPKYVYGQVDSAQNADDHHDDGSEHAHGAYSSEPMVQQAYNPEAYGSYAAYDAQGGYNAGGYQDATREYQGQEGYAVAGYDNQAYAYESHPYNQAGYNGGQQGAYDAAQYAQYDQYAAADPSQYAQYDQSAYASTAPQGQATTTAASDPRQNHNDAYGGM